MITFLHGTITHQEDTDGPKGWAHTLETRFSDGIGANTPIFALDRLQRRCKGDLDI
jgi:hypothetical protein